MKSSGITADVEILEGLQFALFLVSSSTANNARRLESPPHPPPCKLLFCFGAQKHYYCTGLKIEADGKDKTTQTDGKKLQNHSRNNVSLMFGGGYFFLEGYVFILSSLGRRVLTAITNNQHTTGLAVMPS